MGRTILRRESIMAKTRIEWSTDSWNPIRWQESGAEKLGYHCTKLSPACEKCYAQSMNQRFGDGMKFSEHKKGKFVIVENILEQPPHWKKPRRIFNVSMGDIFHPDVPFAMVAQLWNVWQTTRRHTHIVLTKRPERAIEYAKWMAGSESWRELMWPANVWLGVTAENQEMINERVHTLLKIPAITRFVSIEPIIGPVSLRWMRINPRPESTNEYDGLRSLDWIIVGGQTGLRSIPANMEWVENILDQCQKADVPFFFKVVGGGSKDNEVRGKVWHQLPGQQ